MVTSILIMLSIGQLCPSFMMDAIWSDKKCAVCSTHNYSEVH